MMKKRRNQLILSLLSKKKDPENNENIIDFRWSDVQDDEEDIALAKIDWEFQKQAGEENLQKITGWLFDRCGIVPNKKIKMILFGVISNTKILYIKFC